MANQRPESSNKESPTKEPSTDESSPEERLPYEVVDSIKNRPASEIADIGMLCIQEIKTRIYANFGGHGALKKAAEALDLHPSTLTNAFSAAKHLRRLADIVS